MTKIRSFLIESCRVNKLTTKRGKYKQNQTTKNKEELQVPEFSGGSKMSKREKDWLEKKKTTKG